MVQTTAHRRDAARQLAREIFHKVNKPANLNLDDLLAAISSVDDMMNGLPTALDQTRSVKANFVANFPATFKNNTNGQEKALALVAWALKETGLI